MRALEASGCVGHGTAWQPCYLVARDDQGSLGALPLFIKYDSHGEFVFDWGWADAYERSGRNYYPKLVAAIPFTPATGQRLLLRDGLRDRTSRRCCSTRRAAPRSRSAHRRCTCCFRPSRSGRRSSARGFSTRKGCQFHWRNDGYADFDEFLARFSADKRKKAKRERRRVAEAGIVFEHLRGDEPTRRRLGRDHRVLLAHVLAPRPRAVLEPRVLRERRGDDAEQPRDRARAAARRADRRRDLLSQQHDAVRPLLGQRRGLPQPAFRDLLLPRHRLLHPRGPANVSSPARKASTRSRAASCRSRPGRAIGCATRSFTARSARFLTRETRHVDAYMDELGEHVPYRRRSARRRRSSTPEPRDRDDARCSGCRATDARRCISAGRARRSTEPNGLLAAGGDLEPGAAARRLSTRNLPVVSGRAADSLVEPRPACRALAERLQSVAQLAPLAHEARVRISRRHRVRRRRRGLRRAAPLRRRHLDHGGDGGRLRPAASH